MCCLIINFSAIKASFKFWWFNALKLHLCYEEHCSGGLQINLDHMGIFSGIFGHRINARRVTGRPDYHLKNLLVVFSVP